MSGFPRKFKPKRFPQDSSKKQDLWSSRRKKGRLIVRNLPFKITEEQLRLHFEQYGELQDVSLLKRPDGKLVGCGFVEFTKTSSATEAIAATSGKPLLNRPIIVDWAIPKDKFRKNQKTELKEEIKEESISSDEDDHKPSLKSLDSDKDSDDDDDDDASIKSEADGSEDGESQEDESDLEPDSDADEPQKKPFHSHDVEEGCTIFLKNVPFSATKEELRKCMLQFGPVLYALICVDPLTEHSRGTAFVKFQKKENADDCLKATKAQLKLGNAFLEPHAALEKQNLQKQISLKKTDNKSKDGRNLYLVKEGVIQAGTAAAKGVSTTDMTKRLQLERWKTQMLRNLSMVVSRTRLVVHNLPSTLNDEALRKIIKKYAPEGSRLLEARVMRDLRQVDSQGRGRSKEFGFVSFARHEDALAVLRAINNNPDVFTKQQRPVVGFSIENKAILNAKKRRMEISRQKNPYYQQYGKSSTSGSQDKKISQDDTHQTQEETGNFAGLEAHSGQTIKLPTTRTLKSQASAHRANVHKERKQMKIKRKIEMEKSLKIKQRKDANQNKTKKRKNDYDQDDRAIDQLVDNCRLKPEKGKKKKRKWYD